MNAPVQLQQNQAQSVGLLNLESFELSQRIAKMLSSSTLVPEQYRAVTKVKAGKDNFGNMIYRDEPNPNGLSNCVIALNMSNRMGADPLMVMQNLYLIEGRPAWSAQFIMAAINSCGRFSALRFEIEDLGEKEVEYTTTEWVNRKKETSTKKITINDMSCIAFAVERETGERIESSKITIEMAVKEGWFTKNGSKWQTMPEQMLRYRSASFFGRVYAPELLMGLRSADEEQDRIIDVTPADDSVVADQVDVTKFKREILAVRSPAALSKLEDKVLDIEDEDSRNQLLKLIDAQSKKFKPVAAEVEAEVVAEEAPVKKPDAKSIVEEDPDTYNEKLAELVKLAENATSEAEAGGILKKTNKWSAEQRKPLQDAIKNRIAELTTNISKPEPKTKRAPTVVEEVKAEVVVDEDVIRAQLLSDLLENVKNAKTPAEANAQVRYTRSWTEEQRKPLMSAISKRLSELNSQSKPLNERISESKTVDELDALLPELRALQGESGHAMLTLYTQRKEILSQQDIFGESQPEVSYVDAVIARIKVAKNQDDINAEYSDPAFDELSDQEKAEIDYAAQQREAELQG